MADVNKKKDQDIERIKGVCKLLVIFYLYWFWEMGCVDEARSPEPGTIPGSRG